MDKLSRRVFELPPSETHHCSLSSLVRAKSIAGITYETAIGGKSAGTVDWIVLELVTLDILIVDLKQEREGNILQPTGKYLVGSIQSR
jgi:hypothetical protein